MAKIKLNMAGKVVEVEGRRFSHYVNNSRFWFGFHKSLDYTAAYQVTDINSGNRVCFVPYSSICAALGDEIAAARGEIDKLCAKVGDDRVFVVLNSAQPLQAQKAAA